MVINHDKKYIFFHVPKNAGTAMYRIFGSPSGYFDWHAPAKVVKSVLPDFDKYYRFGFLRNPWSRMVSLYVRFIETDERAKAYNNGKGLSHTPADFELWLINHDDSENRRAYQNGTRWFGQSAHWETSISTTRKPQLDYLTDDDGKLLLNEVGRFEDMGVGLAKICSRITALRGVVMNPVMPMVRKGNYSKPYREFYNPTSQAFIAEHFKKDIKFFDYEF